MTNQTTYEDLMEGIALCHTDRAFDALTTGRTLKYVGADQMTMCPYFDDAEDFFEHMNIKQTPRRPLENYALADAAILALVQTAKELNANIMYVVSIMPISADNDGMFVAAEFWHIS